MCINNVYEYIRVHYHLSRKKRRRKHVRVHSLLSRGNNVDVLKMENILGARFFCQDEINSFAFPSLHNHTWFSCKRSACNVAMSIWHWNDIARKYRFCDERFIKRELTSHTSIHRAAQKTLTLFFGDICRVFFFFLHLQLFPNESGAEHSNGAFHISL